ncbi:M1 family metallopeptidase [Longispora albida]|uniref:M1 family metallopeptidase n=1 Tax=Longispora albida TaxID=203523 RepID=UPI0003622160|nr:M1 family metallopeptidase [Longispora albida]
MRRTPLLALPLAGLLLAACTAESATPKAAAPTGGAPGSASPSAAPGVDYAKWSAGKSSPVADTLYPAKGNAQLDVLHYALDLAWAPETKTFTGKATLRIRPVADAAEIKLDFAAYTVDEVAVDGKVSAGTVAQEKLVVPSGVKKDQPVTLTVKYHGTPKTVPMPSKRGDAEGLGLTVTDDSELWTMQEPYGAFTWYPANDFPSDKALYDISVTAPAGWAGIASGTPAGQSGDTYKYTTTDPVASYLTTLVVGKYTKVTDTGPHGIPLTYWYRAGKNDEVLPWLKKSPKQLEWLEARFGPYPFPSGGVVIVPSESGMETQQMITLGDHLEIPADKREAAFDGNLLHEYGHHWFGNSVTTSTWTDLWLNEGWTMYVQYLYQNERDKVTPEQFEQWLRQRDAKLRAEVGPPGKPVAGRFAESNVYTCPAGMLLKIHQKLGDDRFFKLARDWVQTQKNTGQDRASFIAFVNKHTGEDFTALINAWLDSPTTP